jgi:hypothetical protein
MEEKIEINLSECKNQELASTIKQMVSPDYKERFVAEYIQLRNRYFSLKRMVDEWDKGQLSFVPTCPRSTFGIQLRAMADYMAILEARMVMEKIDLTEYPVG